MKKETITFLLVEDDEVDTMAVQRAFRKLKIRNPLQMARNGAEALALLRGNGGEGIQKPYIILLDLNMPKMNGIEFLREIRKDPDHNVAPVFVLTTSDDDKDKSEAWGLNIAGYIVKSHVSQDFLEVVTMLDQYWRVVELPLNHG